MESLIKKVLVLAQHRQGAKRVSTGAIIELDGARPLERQNSPVVVEVLPGIDPVECFDHYLAIGKARLFTRAMVIASRAVFGKLDLPDGVAEKLEKIREDGTIGPLKDLLKAGLKGVKADVRAVLADRLYKVGIRTPAQARGVTVEQMNQMGLDEAEQGAVKALSEVVA